MKISLSGRDELTQFCLYVNEWRVIPRRISPEAVHVELQPGTPLCTKAAEDPGYERCTYPVPLRKDYQKITGKYLHDYLGFDDEDFTDGEYPRNPRPIASDIERDDWFIAATEQGNVLGGLVRNTWLDSMDVDKDHRPDNWKSGPFTQAKFLKKRYRRCIRVYADEEPRELVQIPKEEQSEYLGEWQYITKCNPGKEAKANLSECKDCQYAVESSFNDRSFYDRERGRIPLPYELTWSKACYETFCYLPYVNPYQVASYAKKSRFLEEAVKPNLESLKMLGIDANTKWAASDKKVKEMGEDTSWPGYLYIPRSADDTRKKFKGTPIGDLVEDDPVPGSHALYYLYAYARLDNDPDFIKSGLGAPIGKNLIKFFMDRGVEEANAEHYLDILVNYKSEKKARTKLKKKLRTLNKKNLKTNRDAAKKRYEVRAQIRGLIKTPKVLVKLDHFPRSKDPIYYVNQKCYLSHEFSQLELEEIKSIRKRYELK